MTTVIAAAWVATTQEAMRFASLLADEVSRDSATVSPEIVCRGVALVHRQEDRELKVAPAITLPAYAHDLSSQYGPKFWSPCRNLRGRCQRVHALLRSRPRGSLTFIAFPTEQRCNFRHAWRLDGKYFFRCCPRVKIPATLRMHSYAGDLTHRSPAALERVTV